MFETIGWLAVGAGLVWVSLFTFFITVPTFGEALFTGALWQKVLGVVMWLVIVVSWLSWLSVIRVEL